MNEGAWIKAVFNFDGQYNEASCRLEISNSSTEEGGLKEGSAERTAGSGMTFCKMIADSLGDCEYQEAIQTGENVVKAIFKFPVLYQE
jgi:hypothetical protein